MWVNHRSPPNFQAIFRPPRSCPGPRLQVVRPATSCYSNRVRMPVESLELTAIDRPLPTLRHFLVSPLDRFSFPFLPFLFSPSFLRFGVFSCFFFSFSLLSLSHFPRDKFETNETLARHERHVFAEDRPIGTSNKNRLAILLQDSRFLLAITVTCRFRFNRPWDELF